MDNRQTGKAQIREKSTTDPCNPKILRAFRKTPILSDFTAHREGRPDRFPPEIGNPLDRVTADRPFTVPVFRRR
jgi:hypothetical protein